MVREGGWWEGGGREGDEGGRECGEGRRVVREDVMVGSEGGKGGW